MSIHKGNLETKTGNNTSDILYPKTSIDQVVGLPVPTSADSGKYLGVDSSGNFALISGSTPTGYSVTVTNDSGIDDVYIYDGTDETSTLKGVLVKGQTITYNITSGNIYAKWYDPNIGVSCSLINYGIYENPVSVSSDESLRVGTLDSVINVEITNNSGVDNVRLNDGYARDLGILLIGETQTYVLLNGGLLYGEWDDSFVTESLTFAEWGNPLGNPVIISNDTSLEVLAE